VRRGWPALVAAALLLGACAGPVERAENYAAQDEWMKAVLEYRKATVRDPRDVEFRSRLKQTEHKAADFYYQRGMLFVEQDNLDAAILQFQQGLAAMPDHGKLLQAMNAAVVRKEANALYEQGVRAVEANKPDEAVKLFKRVLEINPEHKRAVAALKELDGRAREEEAADQLALSSRAPITLNFRQTDLRTAFEFVAKSFGVDVIFDESIRSVPVTLFAKDATFEQALNLMLATTKTFYKRVGPNTILIAPDTKEKRGQYEDQFVRTFQLSSIRAKEMADVLKGLINVKKLIVNESLNTLVVRDTEEVIKLVEKVIEANDRRAAELLLEVEILEVNRTKAERLGLDLGSYSVTASIPEDADIPVTGSIRTAIREAITLTLPSATFNFYKQDVDAKTLANPKVRVLSGKTAKIHIGDRVPLRGATTTDSIGVIRTSYDYKDIGIRLSADPIVHLDNSVTVKVGLEVSTLGENIGTLEEPAYRIGTRNAETFMTLRDGETAILGGLIRDEERNTRVLIPGLGDIPAIGSLFTSYDDATGRTDVLLTITPRIVRSWDVPGKAAREFYSGTENVYSDKPLFASLELAAGAQIGVEGTAVPGVAPVTVAPQQTAAGAAPPAVAALAPPAGAPAASRPPQFGFSEPVYEVASNQDFEVRLVGANLAAGSVLPLEVLYNPQLLSYVRGDKGDVAVESFNSSADAARGVLQLSLNLAPGATPADNAVLARVVLRGARPGISYLVYRTPAIKDPAGETVTGQVRASRVVVK
jgi:general secretion pathway protein D